ncbi:hypothetical protein M011DRAFT_140583 [Sporormia fimetaria CBS 119925]|uniref:Uncharacterized protein n=1 Tax=Sporormia fimetaria CBS 119925 TaxID=1340428 RepID=A0A6A6V7F4_9PLEO|nr:hypothetical protein M011DRAFT_140583 [Sporormia fimetaria CBS 119925]
MFRVREGPPPLTKPVVDGFIFQEHFERTPLLPPVENVLRFSPKRYYPPPLFVDQVTMLEIDTGSAADRESRCFRCGLDRHDPEHARTFTDCSLKCRVCDSLNHLKKVCPYV